jgi:hypothetical protein
MPHYLSVSFPLERFKVAKQLQAKVIPKIRSIEIWFGRWGCWSSSGLS